MRILYLNRVINIGGVTKCIIKLSKELNSQHDIIVATQGGELESQLAKINVKHYNLRNVESKWPHDILLNIITIISIVKKEKIDIIHSHHRMTTLISKIVSKFIKVKVIHTQHLCIEDKYTLTKLALNNIKTITVSNAAKNILENKSKLNGANIVTIYNTIDLAKKSIKVDERLVDLKNKGFFIVAQISRMVDYKGIYDFIEVAELTLKKNKNIRFVFIGDGPDYQNMNKIILERGLGQYVYLLGSKENVIEHLAYIDLVLLCSYIEGLPLAPIEAFSQSIPVIATNIDGTNEEIIDGFNGYLVNPKDIEAFVERIQYIYSNNEEYLKLKENACKSFLLNFNEETYIEKHINIYQEILKM